MVILKYLKNIEVPGSEVASLTGVQRMIAVSWSPNGKKLAVAGKDRVIYLYDELGVFQDKFPTRPLKREHGVLSYSVSALAFSPDSTKLAVAQTDGIVFVYKLGEDFKMKKFISNKFKHPDSVVTLVWPNQFEIICGLKNGNLIQAPLRPGNRTQSEKFYFPQTDNISLAATAGGYGLASGHIDGHIALFQCGSYLLPKFLCDMEHSSLPYALAFAESTLFAGGPDKNIIVYNHEGKVLQRFDYERIGDGKDRDFGVACGSPLGTAMVFGSFDRLRIFKLSQNRKRWEDGGTYDAKNMYTVTALKWKPDGTQLAVGTLSGALLLFETILRKTKTTEYELTYLTDFHAIINIKNPYMQAEIVSKYKQEIYDVKILGNCRYAVATTESTLIICDIKTKRKSEINWSERDTNERFYFDNPHVCMIFYSGFLYLVEYGFNCYLGYFRTDHVNPHVVSVRINERVPKNSSLPDKKQVAYLKDKRTVVIVDLINEQELCVVTHSCTIDWIELSEIGHKLLYRDRRLGLHIVDVNTNDVFQLVSSCSYCQWVSGSDVAVAQSNKVINVWYNLNDPKPETEVEVKGLAFDVVTENYETKILIRDGSTVHKIHLDSARIQFETAIDDGDLLRALIYLESFETSTNEIREMWKKLSEAAIDRYSLVIAERACCGYGNYARAHFIKTTFETLNKALEECKMSEADVLKELEAKIGILKGNLDVSEEAYLGNMDVDSAIATYQDFNRWEDVFRVTLTHGDEDQLSIVTENYFHYLVKPTRRLELAEFLKHNKLYNDSLRVFMESGFPGHAAQVIKEHYVEMNISMNVLRSIGHVLCGYENFHDAAAIFTSAGDQQIALKCYISAEDFNRAVSIARTYFPEQVVQLEEAWGDQVFKLKKMDQACDHYVQAGNLKKALIAGLGCRRWTTAIQIIEAIDDDSTVPEECVMIGDHFQKKGDLANAETFYIKANQSKKAIKMYIKQSKFEEAYRVAFPNLRHKKEVRSKFLRRAEVNVKEGRLDIAEKLFIIVGEVDRAINMYANFQHYDQLLRLVESYHPNLVETSLIHVAELLKHGHNLKAAEQYYLKCGETLAAVEMYQEKGLWDDAYRVAQNNLPPSEWKQVIYTWSCNLGGELAVKLLQQHGYLDYCVEYSCKIENFDFAFQIAPYASEETQLNTYYFYGQYLENLGNFQEAGENYILGRVPLLAVDMFLKHEMYEQAIEVAEYHQKSELPRVYTIYAQSLFEDARYQQFEKALLRVKLPSLAVQMYKEKDMWMEALTFCKKNIPNEFDYLNDEFDACVSYNTRVRSTETLLKEADDWEKMEEFKRCIDCYLKLKTTTTENSEEILVDSYKKAGDLAMNHLDLVSRKVVLETLCPMVMELGLYDQAATWFLATGNKHACLKAYCDGDIWDAARDTAKTMGIEWVEYVENRYSETKQSTRNVDELALQSLSTELEALVQNGEWEICLEKAKLDPETFVEHLGIYISTFLKKKQTLEALEVYKKYGTPTHIKHYVFYQLLLYNVCFDLSLDTYEVWRQLRDLFLAQANFLDKAKTPDVANSEMFKKYLFIAHLYTNRAVFRNVPDLEDQVAKINVSLLRYTDIIPAERAFFEAGFSARAREWNNMAFVLLNHYLDIHDAIEEKKFKNTYQANLNYTLLQGTDIPTSSILTTEYLISEPQYEEVKEWVLATSLDRRINMKLPLDTRGEFEGSCISSDYPGNCLPCLITGYPTLKNSRVLIGSETKAANKADWNKFILISGSGKHLEMKEMVTFINKWCQTSAKYEL